MGYFSEMPAVTALIPLIIGVVSCFWGYRLFRVVLGIMGFILAAFFAGSFAYGLSDGSVLVATVAAIIGGFIGAFLVSFVYFLGVFILGAAGGWVMGTIVAGAAAYGSRFAVGIVLAVLCGVLAVVLQRIVIIMATATIGAWNVIAALYLLVGGAWRSPLVFWNPGWMFRVGGGRSFVMLLLWLALSIAGIIFQMRFGRERRIEEKTKD
jgi:hypothetical protein